MHKILKSWLTAGHEKKILLLRHGDTGAGDDEKRFIGQSDVPLNDMGRHQAHYWRQCLAEAPPAHIVSSDLRRCMQTARIIAAGQHTPVTPQAGLREILLGKWEGMTFRRVRERWPDAFEKRGRDLAHFRPPGGESFLDLQHRAVPAFEQAVRQPGRRILIVAHAGVNRMILCHLLGMPAANLFRISQDCGALNLIDDRAGRHRIVSLNLIPSPSGRRNGYPAAADRRPDGDSGPPV
ncbi:alpha-ribazole phosphatase [Desulfosarcina alkanivorans]|jgi:probable phosphoglycerate mutase|uniref:Alpha-ribazole phosphatase n=1 Tax=Desulfosarcina alkanivorans TaxID=571177 RepID=A0A5K7YLN4_9BACT|nr:alpha-ribazole phosphatase [Desulfosarcina alkanivorans]BBO67741.1 alpha-ribazole phosphatase [Desulfosarcina alkanivorans]